MEELFVYAILTSVGYDLWKKFENTLDYLFLQYPDHAEYLKLESMSQKEALLRILSFMNTQVIDHNKFGKALMTELQNIYKKSSIKDFATHMLKVWKRLPASIGNTEEPFFALIYADDCLSFGDEKQCREIYENAMHHYD